MDLWGSTLLKHNEPPPFLNHADLYNTIDSIPLGHIPWECIPVRYSGELPDGEPPDWMLESHEVWFRDPRKVVHAMLANPDYNGRVDYAPVQVFDSEGHREYQHFMSGDWAWEQAVCYLCLLLFDFS